MYMKNGLNKFLELLSGTEKLLGGSTRSLAYIDHTIQFGLNKFLASLSGNRIDEFKYQYSNQKGIHRGLYQYFTDNRCYRHIP